MAGLEIRPIAPPELEAVRGLWERCGLVRPWNDPAADIDFCRASGHGAVLVGIEEGRLVASILVGHDGHRGWVYYLAVEPALQGHGRGRRMMAAAEAWLRERAVPKVELMVRAENDAVRNFYRRLGYADSGVRVMEHWLTPPKVAKPGPQRLETVVTYLEMRAPPLARPPRQPPHKLALLRAPRPSVSFYRHLYAAVGEPWFWYERRAMTDADLSGAIGAEGIEISVLYADGEPAGFAELDFRAKADVNLVYLGLVPHFIGHGMGSYLLAWVLDDVWRRGPERLWVHTCSLDHPRALRLYQRAGFVAYKQETKVIDDPRDLGLIPATVPLPAAARLAAPAAE
ncbi:MAG: GNAT family acetyltransferase [Alphaproteobacteria bacterium]